MEHIKFLKNFILSPGKIGAIAPSSSGLADLITESADLKNTSHIIEFGSGTGVFTEAILKKISSQTNFFVVEINPQFVVETRKRCPNATVYEDSATNARKYLEQMGATHCDRIICGLPWASFPEKLQNDLLDTIVDVLKPDGKFLTFAYLQGLLLPAGQRFRKKLFSRFSKVTLTKTVWQNIPPAFVYIAEK